MVDNRSAGLLGIGGNINFKSGDISGTAAKTADDRSSQGTEYFAFQQEEQQKNDNYVDRSMQLRASLNSLALINVASVLNNKMRPKTVLEQLNKDESASSKVPVSDNEKQKGESDEKEHQSEDEK